MDGKKRIARLRNAEKWKWEWKKVGLGAFNVFFEAKKEHSLLAKVVDDFKEVPRDVPGVKPKKKMRNLGLPRTDGKVWDSWTCSWNEPPKPGPFGSARAMITALQKKGFKMLGSGHYSTVLAKPGSDKVIKVTRHQDNWIDYVKWAAEKGYAGGFAPKVYSWKKFPGGWSWAVMERMERTLDGGYDYRDDYDEMSASESEHDLSLIFSLLTPASRGNTMAQVYMEDLVPGAYSFVKELKATLRAGDIRGANTMIRKDGSLCFTDPCAGETKITKTRLRSGDFSPSVWRYLIEGCYRHRD